MLWSKHQRTFGQPSIKLLKGRYGPYVSDGEVNASLPRDMENPESLTMDHALELLAVQREKKGKKKKAKKKAAKKKAAKKKTSKKKAAKKSTSKKNASKKAPTRKKAASASDADEGAANEA